jgi:Domain of unknown function (DUF4249)
MLISIMKNLIYNLAFILGICVMLQSCTDPVEVDLPGGTPQLSVDGWLYSNTSRQEIKLTMTTAYFDTNAQPAVTNAKVYVTDLTAFQQYTMLQEVGKPGIYAHNSFKPVVGHTYQLDIYRDFEHFVSQDQVKRVPDIDSLEFTPRKKDTFREKDTWELYLWARDIPGKGDYYKFNTILNGKLRNEGEDINIADDVSTDGLYFIPPISNQLNVTEFSPDIDTVTVRILSLSATSYAFWNTVERALNNGGLFATPVANVLCNILNVNPDSPVKAVGFFGCSGVSTKTRVVGQKQK